MKYLLISIFLFGCFVKAQSKEKIHIETTAYGSNILYHEYYGNWWKHEKIKDLQVKFMLYQLNQDSTYNYYEYIREYFVITEDSLDYKYIDEISVIGKYQKTPRNLELTISDCKRRNPSKNQTWSSNCPINLKSKDTYTVQFLFSPVGNTWSQYVDSSKVKSFFFLRTSGLEELPLADDENWLEKLIRTNW